MELIKFPIRWIRFITGTPFIATNGKVGEDGTKKGIFVCNHNFIFNRMIESRLEWVKQMSINQRRALQVYYFDQFNFVDGSEETHEYMKLFDAAVKAEDTNQPMTRLYENWEFLHARPLPFMWRHIWREPIILGLILLFLIIETITSKNNRWDMFKQAMRDKEFWTEIQAMYERPKPKKKRGP